VPLLLVLIICSTPRVSISADTQDVTADAAPHSYHTIANASTGKDDLSRQYAKALALYDEGHIHEAITAQAAVVSQLETLQGQHNPQAANVRAFLKEMEQVARLSSEEKQKYQRARLSLVSGVEQIRLEDYRKARSILEPALETFATLLGDDCVTSAGTLEQIGIATIRDHLPEVAKNYFVRATAARRATVGPNHPDMANALYLLGSSCLDARQYAEGETYLREALSIDRKHCAMGSSRYAAMLERMAQAMLGQQRTLEAEAFCLQAISITEQNNAQKSLPAAGFLSTLAEIHVQYGEFEVAEAHLSQSLQLHERLLSARSPQMINLWERRAQLAEKLHRPEEAKTFQSRANEIRKQHDTAQFPTSKSGNY